MDPERLVAVEEGWIVEAGVVEWNQFQVEPM